MSEEKNPQDPKKTNFLRSDDAEPMKPRQPRPNTSMLTDKWQIILQVGEQKQVLEFKETLLIGRAIESESRPADEVGLDLTPFGAYHFGVSRHHAIMSLKEGYLYLEDLGSTNGTRINGFQLTSNQKYRLRDGDEVEFARMRSTLRFKAPGSRA